MCSSSTAHFRTAMSSSFSSQRPCTNSSRRPPSGSKTEAETVDEARRTHVCHHPQCFKAYKQASGLKYHLKHVSRRQCILLRPKFNLCSGAPLRDACSASRRPARPRSPATLQNKKNATESVTDTWVTGYGLAERGTDFQTEFYYWSLTLIHTGIPLGAGGAGTCSHLL